MKKLLYMVVFFTIFLTLTACNINNDCDNNEQLIGGECIDTDILEIPEADRDNLFKLNVGNTEGWELFTNHKTEPSMYIRDGSFIFTQANKDENNTWSRKFMYRTLEIDVLKDYIIEFDAIGTENETITIHLQFGSTVYVKEFTLDGNNQLFTLDIDDAVTVNGSGVFVIGLGTFSNGSTVTISNIVIIEKEVIDDGMNILFIGNSFTFFNNMPNMVKQMGLSSGYDVNVESITNGGYALIQYVTSGSTATQQVIDKLNEKDWDYVVIQEHSSKPDTNKTEFLYSVNQLNQLITESGAKTILYSTWSYRDGSDKLASTGYTYTEFYNSLTNAYIEAANTYDTLRAPVGTVFYNLTMEQTSTNLLNNNDDFHPNVAGSYVAAYTFYTMIFGEDSNNDYLPSGLSANTASILRTYVLEALNTED